MKKPESYPKFDKATATQVCSALLNPYGFDLTDENLIGWTTGKMKFVVMGFKATSQYHTLIATVKMMRSPHEHDEYTHVEQIDLYNQNRVDTYVRTAAFRLKLTEDEIKKGISSLRERLERYKLALLKSGGKETKEVTISREEQTEAMEILQSDNVMDSIEGLLIQAGIATEKENALRLYFILLSRHFERPLHALLQGSRELSRMLMDTLSSTLPPEEIHEQTSMSAGSLYYTRSRDYWKNKVLYLTNIDKQFKGAGTLREFLENQQLSRYTTESDHKTRQLYANTKTVEGSICLMAYSEDDSMNAKYFNECFLLRVEENAKNTTEMMTHFQKESAGLIDTKEQDKARRTLIAIGRNVKPLRVVVPYASEIQLPGQVDQPIRSFTQLVTFIKAVALLHQYRLKRQVDTEGQWFIEATAEHLEIALELMKSIVVTQSDRLNPSQRSLLEQLKQLVGEEDKSFKIQDAMKAIRMTKSSFYREFNTLKELGCVVYCSGNKKKGIEYKIAEWNDYKDLKAQTEVLDSQLKVIRVSFPQVSQKIPKSGKVAGM
jgi:DNA primase